MRIVKIAVIHLRHLVTKTTAFRIKITQIG
jgi:hypothetical protein